MKKEFQEFLMPKRVQSPSSISTYKQCPRKYFYQYVLKLPTQGNIHTLRGSITHEVLENFFDLDHSKIPSVNAQQFFFDRLQSLLVSSWKDKLDEWDSLNIDDGSRFKMFEETYGMLRMWSECFFKKFNSIEGDFSERFKNLTPEREQHFVSHTHGVQGYIDVIEKIDGKTRIMDYKTSSKFDLNSYKLQLGIYALLHQEKFGDIPDEVGVYFLKGNVEKSIPVTDELVDLAAKEVSYVHKMTECDNIEEYPKKVSPLCKWSSGRCDFYDHCFKKVNVEVKR